MSETLFTIRAYPRLHFGLIDLSGATRRSYGGLGVAVDALAIEVQAFASDIFELNLDSIDADPRRCISRAVERARESTLPLSGKYIISAQVPNHVGLGSTTTTTMAVLQSIALVNSWPHGNSELVELSGRGRTSGVGTHTFFSGGLVIDVGQRGHPVGNYLPSLQPEGRAPSLVVGRWDMPHDWVVYLFFTSENPSVTPAEESTFFASAAPTNETDTLHQVACLYHGILPAILEKNTEVLAASLNEFQTRGFKACEIAAQAEHVRNTLSILWDNGIAAGLSSFGPTVFAIEERGEFKVQDLFPSQISVQGPFEFRNRGYDIV